MGEKLDKHIFMTIAEVCAETQQMSGFTTIKSRLMHFRVLIKNLDFKSIEFKNTITIITNVLNKIYGFDNNTALEYVLKFFENDNCLKFGDAAMLLYQYNNGFGNDRYLKFDNSGKISLNC